MAKPSESFATNPPECLLALWRTVRKQFPRGSAARTWLNAKVTEHYSKRSEARQSLRSEDSVPNDDSRQDVPLLDAYVLTAAIYDAYPAGEPIFTHPENGHIAAYHAVNCRTVQRMAESGLSERALKAIDESVEQVCRETATCPTTREDIRSTVCTRFQALRVGSARAAKRKPTNGEESDFPYPYDTDLHWLWGWGARIKARVDDDRPANEFDWMVFRPDSSARDAMMRFSLQFPHVIKQVEDYLDFVERCYEEFSKAPGDAQSDNCVGAMDDLQRRIETAAATISSATKPLQTPAEITADEANARARKALKGKPPKGNLWSVRKLAKAIGCSTGTATNLPAYQAYAEAKGIKRADVPKPKAVALTRAVEAQSGAEDEELQRLIAEQAADLEPSPLTAPSHRRRGRRKQL